MSTNALTLLANLPGSFHEVHGHRPLRFASLTDLCAWLARMEAATLTSATNALHIAEATGDWDALEDARAYLDAHHAIAALHA